MPRPIACRLPKLLALAGIAAGLSGCVAYPYGDPAYGYAGPVVAPAPYVAPTVVVAPRPYYHYRPRPGWRRW